MISRAQAIAVADRWLNPDGVQAPQRRVGIQEFDLGWVVWAVPPPPERDPVTGERRPPAEIGNACGVVDRRTGQLSVWPSVPVDEVVRMYQLKHRGTGGGSDGKPPVTGPGNTTVITYLDHRNGEGTACSDGRPTRRSGRAETSSAVTGRVCRKARGVRCTGSPRVFWGPGDASQGGGSPSYMEVPPAEDWGSAVPGVASR